MITNIVGQTYGHSNDLAVVFLTLNSLKYNPLNTRFYVIETDSLTVNLNVTTAILWRGARLDWAQKLRLRWRALYYYQTQVLRKLKKQCQSYVTESQKTRPVINLVQAFVIILKLCRASVTAIIGSVTWKGLKKNEGVPYDSWTANSASLQQNHSIMYPQIFAVHSSGISHI
jgi:hypothetical protein